MRIRQRVIWYSSLASLVILCLLFLVVPGTFAGGKALNTLSHSQHDFTSAVTSPTLVWNMGGPNEFSEFAATTT
jgi:hypothetical protein